MTENKALKLGKSLYENITSNANNIIPTKEYIDFVGMAIQAIEETQQYRAIGTVEELQKLKGVITDFPIDCGIPISDIEEIWNQLKKYLAIGTIEEFKALKEKSVAKKPILNNPKINEFYIKEAKLCPSCHSYINNCSGDYCRDCGQRIDWSE